MTCYIATHKEEYGVEPICRALEIAPSTYYAAASRPPCERERQDQALRPEVTRVHTENFGVYGVHKVWRQLNREGFGVGRDRVGRLMRSSRQILLGLRTPIYTQPVRVPSGCWPTAGPWAAPGSRDCLEVAGCAGGAGS